jgi:hypothetical protein
MRGPIAVLACIAATAMLTGCAPGANDELRSLVDEIAPAKRKMKGCEWQTIRGAAEAKSYYACTWYVPGTMARVGRPIISRAIANGFTVYCEGAGEAFEAQGSRGKTGLVVIVLGPGFVSTETISADDVDIPAGHVLVTIGAVEFDARVPRGDPRSRCVA